MAICASLGALAGGAILNAGGRGFARGLIVGGLGGASLAAAFFMRKLPNVLLEASVCTATVTISSIVADSMYQAFGYGKRRPLAEYAADAFDTFMMSAFISTFANWEQWDVKDAGEYLCQSLVIDVFNGIVSSFSAMITVMSLITDSMMGDGNPDVVEFYKQQLREEIRHVFEIMGANPLDPIGPGILIDALSANGAAKLATRPLFKSLDSRSIAVLNKNMTKIFLLAPALIGANYFSGFNYTQYASETIDHMSDSFVETVFYAIQRSKKALDL